MFNFDHFDWLSPHYDRVFKANDINNIINFGDLPVAGMILDVGGGTGRISQCLVGMVNSVVIADYSIGMLKQAEKKDGLITICSKAERLPFPPMSFERVIMVDALHHVFDQHETLHELWRVVKPGGKIVIEEPDVSHIIVKIVAVVEKLLFMRSHFINPLRIVKILETTCSNIVIKREGVKYWVIIERNKE